MSVQAFTVEGSLQKYDFNALENSPIAKGSGVGSLVVARSDNPNVASGNGSFAGGAGSQATGLCSFAYGSYSPNYPSPVASGATAFSFGLGTESSGNYSVSLGYLAKAKATASFAIGRSVTANGAYSIVLGRNNIEDTNQADSSGQRKYVFIVGNGTNSEPSNAMTVDWDGNEVLAGKLTLGAEPTANMDAATKQYVDNAISFITPEMYGAKGDGLTDDTTALKTAFENGGVVFLRNGATYLVSDLTVENSENLTVIGYGATIKVKKEFEFASYIQRCCLKLENCTNVKFDGLTFDASWREIKEYHNLEVNTTMENYCVRLLEGNNGVNFYKCIFGNQLKVCLQTQGSYLGGDTSDPANIDSTFVPNKNIDIGYCTFGWNYEPGLHNGAIQLLELPQVATDVNVKIHDNLILKSGVHGMHIYYGNNNVIIENNVVLDSGHCVLEDYYAGGGTVVFGYGIEVTSCNKVTIKNNLVHNFIAGGICVFNDGWHTAGDIHDIFIESNVVEQEPAYSTEFRGHGILLGHADDGVISNNTCKSVYRTANVGSSISAICVSESNHAVVSGNIVFDCENGCFFNYTKDVSCEHNQIHALNNRQGNNVAFGAGFYSTENISCANNIFDLGSSTSTKFDGIMISTVVLAVLSGNVFNGLRYGIKDNSTSVTNATIFGSVFKSVSNKYVWWGTHTDLVVDFVAVPNS